MHADLGEAEVSSSSCPASASAVNTSRRGEVGGFIFDPTVRLRDWKHTGRFKQFFFSLFHSNQSEDRKSFRPPFLTAGLSSRISILLRRCTTQFFALGVLEDEELEPEVVEEVEPLEGDRERRRERKWVPVAVSMGNVDCGRS